MGGWVGGVFPFLVLYPCQSCLRHIAAHLSAPPDLSCSVIRLLCCRSFVRLSVRSFVDFYRNFHFLLPNPVIDSLSVDVIIPLSLVPPLELVVEYVMARLYRQI